MPRASLTNPDPQSLQALLDHVCRTRPQAFVRAPRLTATSVVSDGDTHRCYLLHATPHDCFLKLASTDAEALLAAEARSLLALADTGTIATCRPLAQGRWQHWSYLLLPRLQLDSSGDWHKAGRQLAALHRWSDGETRYGFATPAYCGSTPQPAGWDSNWARFFARQRIGHQLSLLYGKPVDHRLIRPAVARTEALLSERQPVPALLHGDLWSGNIGFSEGEPVIFDPACYYGDPETDLAMTELFGKLPAAFYSGYHEACPMDCGYPQRRRLYQLYHLLNHANLFGGHYRQLAESELRWLTR